MADIANLLKSILERTAEEDAADERRQKRRLAKLREEKRRRRHESRPDDLRRPLAGRYVSEALADAEN